MSRTGTPLLSTEKLRLPEETVQAVFPQDEQAQPPAKLYVTIRCHETIYRDRIVISGAPTTSGEYDVRLEVPKVLSEGLSNCVRTLFAQSLIREKNRAITPIRRTSGSPVGRCTTLSSIAPKMKNEPPSTVSEYAFHKTLTSQMGISSTILTSGTRVVLNCGSTLTIPVLPRYYRVEDLSGLRLGCVT